MISQKQLSKALLDRLAEITNIHIAIDGEKFDPEINQDYLEEKEVPTSNTLPLGDGLETQRGFYQVNVCTPFSKGKFYHADIVDGVRLNFGRGARVAANEYVYVTVNTIGVSGMYSDETHLKTALTINYTVIA